MPAPTLSVLIPTRARPAHLAACLDRLAPQNNRRGQTLPPADYEILVGHDGDSESLLPTTAHGPSPTVRIDHFPHAGPAATRNRLFAHARGEIILLLNDDVLAAPDLLEQHLRAHDDARRRALHPLGVMVLGDAPWRRPAPDQDTLFDRLIRDTSMIFFYDRMHARLREHPHDPAARDHDWGYRHAWTLNLSLPAALWREAGGFSELLAFPAYEDLEFARRIALLGPDRRVPVLFRPEALVEHDHRITPADYLRRERMLGRAARQFAAACPDAARETFGRDLLHTDELAYARAYVDRERAAADRLRESFLKLAGFPADLLDSGERGAFLLNALYEQHLPLKRWEFRAGLLEEPEPVKPTARR